MIAKKTHDEPRDPPEQHPASGVGRIQAGAAAAGELDATRSYVVVEGDTLAVISTRVYGAADRWHLILEANREHVPDPDRLRPGLVLKIPVLP